MKKQDELADRLRLQLIGALHVGLLRPGSKLPSIRETAQRYGMDHRTVARAYTQLELDRLVEIRGRSGVYVAEVESPFVEELDERMRWFAAVLRDSWSRGITFAEFNSIAHRTTLHRLRCVCVETTVDHLVACASELASDFGLTVIPIRFMQRRDGSPDRADRQRIMTELQAADLIVTTAFHASVIREIAQIVGKPMIAISINPGMRKKISTLIQQGPLRVVVADAAFEARVRLFLSQMAGGKNVEVVQAAHYKGMTDDGKRTVFTKAARRALALAEFHLLAPEIPFISEESALAICELVVHLASDSSRDRAVSE